jgi:hypothetical protein
MYIWHDQAKLADLLERHDIPLETSKTEALLPRPSISPSLNGDARQITSGKSYNSPVEKGDINGLKMYSWIAWTIRSTCCELMADLGSEALYAPEGLPTVSEVHWFIAKADWASLLS